MYQSVAATHAVPTDTNLYMYSHYPTADCTTISSYNLPLFVRPLVPHPPISNQYRLLSVIVPPLSSGITSFPRITVASPSPGTGSYSILPAPRYFPTVPTPVHIPAITAILTPPPSPATELVPELSKCPQIGTLLGVGRRRLSAGSALFHIQRC